MTPEQFIAKWQANTRGERAACQEHFIDLCQLLGEPTPNSDPDGATYAFEKGATKATGGEGWADVWRQGCFAWEYKGKHKDLGAAHRQLLQYAGALGNPPLLVVCDIARVVVRTNWTNAVTVTHEVALAELTDPARRQLLKHVLSDPERLRPDKTREALTAQAAGAFAELATRLRTRGHAPQAVAHFVNRLVFCLFADDVGLLPPGLFARLLAGAAKRPARFEANATRLFAAMARRDGEIDFTPIAWFNGGLFDDDAALPLEADDVALLQRCEALDWAEIDPSILGTLFERGLDPDKRSQLGAHYTDRAKIEKLIDPVIRRPLLAEWQAAKARIVAAQDKAAATKSRKRNGAPPGKAELDTFLDRLRAFRVLDPACGSGNFLYLALLALKDLELRAMVEAEALGLQREFPQVGPQAVLGIEINPYAAELARVSVWIGEIQWMRRHGLSPRTDPLLRKLDTIECRDAILTPDGTVADWPKVDAIVGNPPFLGGKLMRRILGDQYCEALFAAYAGRVPAEADLVCYWFELAREALANGAVKRAGLVATNSIRGGANRAVLEAVEREATIFEAWSDEAWTIEGAAVRVSLVCFTTLEAAVRLRLDGAQVPRIHTDLTGVGDLDLTRATALRENAGVAFMGVTPAGPFDVPEDTGRVWLEAPANPNGRPNSDVVRPYANAMDVTRRTRRVWTVDFGCTMDERDASYYVLPYAHVERNVKPIRMTNAREAYRRFWWRYAEPRPAMRAKLGAVLRYIATPMVAKHRVFVWFSAAEVAANLLNVIARDDDTTFGILHSRFHELWSLRLGTWLGVGNDPRYTPTTTFETFPFPENLTPNIPAAAYAADKRAENIAAAARALVESRNRWLNPPDLVRVVPEVVPGFPDRILPIDEKAAAVLKQRTLTKLYNTRGTPEGAWLDHLHSDLDAAVAAAYGWPADLSDEQVLAHLLALNLQRASA